VVAKLLAINWKHILSIRTLRNQEINGQNPDEAAVIQRKNLITEIINLREPHPDIPHATQLINKDRQELEQLPVRVVAAYLHSVKIITRAHRRYQKRRHWPTTQRITHYFHPARTRNQREPTDRSKLDPGK
jgi:hypothetical protein